MKAAEDMDIRELVEMTALAIADGRYSVHVCMAALQTHLINREIKENKKIDVVLSKMQKHLEQCQKTI